MSLDQNLFTLAIATSAEESGALDLTDPNTSTIHYRKRFDPPDPEKPYSWGLYGLYESRARGSRLSNFQTLYPMVYYAQ
jgi:hypothetical protein